MRGVVISPRSWCWTRLFVARDHDVALRSVVASDEQPDPFISDGAPGEASIQARPECMSSLGAANFRLPSYSKLDGRVDSKMLALLATSRLALPGFPIYLLGSSMFPAPCSPCRVAIDSCRVLLTPLDLIAANRRLFSNGQVTMASRSPTKSGFALGSTELLMSLSARAFNSLW